MYAVGYNAKLNRFFRGFDAPTRDCEHEILCASVGVYAESVERYGVIVQPTTWRAMSVQRLDK